MKNISSLANLLQVLCMAYLALMGINASAQAAQFEYDLKITADPTKRAAYLKQSGDTPSPYEQVFNLIKGSCR